MKQVWKCDWCRRTHEDPAEIQDHEAECFYNPATRTCGSCAYFLLDYDQVRYCNKARRIDVLAVQEDGEDCSYWVHTEDILDKDDLLGALFLRLVPKIEAEVTVLKEEGVLKVIAVDGLTFSLSVETNSEFQVIQAKLDNEVTGPNGATLRQFSTLVFSEDDFDIVIERIDEILRGRDER